MGSEEGRKITKRIVENVKKIKGTRRKVKDKGKEKEKEKEKGKGKEKERKRKGKEKGRGKGEGKGWNKKIEAVRPQFY